MIGLDTTALIDMYKNDEKLIQALQSLNQELFLNDLTYLELLAGLNPQNKQHQKEEAFYDKHYAQIKSFSFTKQAAKQARNILWELKKKGKTISVMDATIIAIYQDNNVHTILTRNKKDFSDIPQIKVLTY